jgi:hypothetical protein
VITATEITIVAMVILTLTKVFLVFL